jgi:pimeloyl-ACP methyl ester carboxylesterase
MSKTAAWRRWVGVALCSAASTLWAQGVECLPRDAPWFGQPKNGAQQSVVVYLHGLHGDAKATWTTTGETGGSVAWPCLVLEDAQAFGASNVYTASYRSVPGQPNPTIDNAARLIARDLATDGVLAHAHVTVVAHSMGGIVLARMLTQPGLLSAEERSRIRLVVFVGTPAEPTEAADICSKFGVNSQCAEMSDAAAMQRLWAAWDSLLPRPAAWCVAEGKDMWWLGMPPWKRIVPERSAHRPCRSNEQRSVAEGLDHSDVAKPPAIGQRPHRDLRNAFAACVKPKMASGQAPDSAEDRALAETVSHWFYRLKDRLHNSEDWLTLLRGRLASENEVARYWYPKGNSPSFDSEAYEPLPPNLFVQALRQVLPELLPRADFAWARPVARASQMIADSAFASLMIRAQAIGVLRDSDVVVAIKPRTEVEGQILLLLRPGSSNQPVEPGVSVFGTLAVWVIPKPVDRCVGV